MNPVFRAFRPKHPPRNGDIRLAYDWPTATIKYIIATTRITKTMGTPMPNSKRWSNGSIVRRMMITFPNIKLKVTKKDSNQPSVLPEAGLTPTGKNIKANDNHYTISERIYKVTTVTLPSSAASSGASTSSATISARRAYPWPRRPSRISSNLRSGFTSERRGRLAPPPGLESTCGGGPGGRPRG